MNDQNLEARNHRLGFTGGDSRPQLFECSDEEEWVLKLMGNAQGTITLAADWIGSALSLLIGVPTPESSIINVTADALRTAPSSVQEWAAPGPAFGSLFVTQNNSFAGAAAVTQCANVSDIGKMAVADTWLQVEDREKPDRAWNMLIDTSLDVPELRVIDYGLSLRDHLAPVGILLRDQPAARLVCPDPLRPYLDWEAARQAVNAMLSMPEQQIEDIVQSVPTAWNVDNEHRQATIEHLCGFRTMVAQLVEQEAAGS